jgi:hypothetical protein
MIKPNELTSPICAGTPCRSSGGVQESNSLLRQKIEVNPAILKTPDYSQFTALGDRSGELEICRCKSPRNETCSYKSAT